MGQWTFPTHNSPPPHTHTQTLSLSLTHTHTQTHTHRHTDTQTHTQTHTDTHTLSPVCFVCSGRDVFAGAVLEGGAVFVLLLQAVRVQAAPLDLQQLQELRWVWARQLQPLWLVEQGNSAPDPTPWPDW